MPTSLAPRHLEAGVRHVWYIDPATKTAELYTAAENPIPIDVNGFLTATDLLPGFQLRLGELFDSVKPPSV
jgi:Uma2 family endonuclease